MIEIAKDALLARILLSFGTESVIYDVGIVEGFPLSLFVILKQLL
jgi:hypothetical protein